MNILYIDHYAGSPEMGMEFRPYYLAREWGKLGHTVSILAGDFSHLRIKNPVVKRDMQRDDIDGIAYYWLKTGDYHGNGVRRAVTMARFCWKLFLWRARIYRILRPDVVISSSTYPIDAIPAHFICGQGDGVRHIHEVHDMWPSTLTELGGMSRWNPFVLLMGAGERYAYSHADAVVSLPPYAQPYMREHGLKAGKFHHINNGIVEEEWTDPLPLPEEHEDVLRKLREAGKFIVGYFGGHALSNCLMPLIQAAEQRRDKTVQFVLVGGGVEKEHLMRCASGLDNVTFLPPVAKRCIPRLTASFDCVYIGAKSTPLYRFGISMNKMFDCMMSGKPVLFAVNAPPTPVDQARCGLMVEPENPAALNAAIDQLMNLPPSERAAMGSRGRAEVRNRYTYEKLAGEFLDVMR